jgi:glyoxylase I family protein
MKSVVNHLSHACFSCIDLDTTRHFYEDILGFQVVHEFRSDRNELYGIYLSIGRSTFLEFFKGPVSSGANGVFRHICLAVNDIHSLNMELQKVGLAATVQRGRTDRTLQMWVMDPNGIKIEFHEYDPQSLLSKFQE